MKVCAVSAKPRVGNKKKNVRKMIKYIEEEDADLYIFGEMFLTGYICRDEIYELAEGLEGESVREMREVAQQKDCTIIFGMPYTERKGIIYNSAIMIKPDGVGIYKKNFLANFGPFEERFYFKTGENIPVFNTKFCGIGICICYDIFFPELVKSLALNGADLIVCISASPSTTRIYFEKVLPARAIENTVFMAYSNLVGEEDGLVFWGGSQLYSPKGELLAKTEYFNEDYITYDVDLKLLKEARMARPTLRDTNPDIFLDLYNIARRKEMFNEDVKRGMEMGRTAIEKLGKVEKAEVYGNEDIAFGIKLVTNCDIELHKEKRCKAIFRRGDEEIEIQMEK